MDDNINSDIKSLVERIFSHLENGTVLTMLSPQEPRDFSGVYSLACDYYDKGLIEQAEKIFRSLCLYDFNNINYLLGLAAVKQVQKQYQKAINLYSLAINLDKNNALTYFYMGQCHFFTGDKETALYYFNECLSLGCDESERESIQNYIAILHGGK